MARKARQRISYVLPLANSPGGHRLGVNGLAVDAERSILYSGGRDGLICAWDLNIEVENGTSSLKNQVSISENNSGYPSRPSSSSTFRQQVQAHTHWVNDIILTQSNSALVSASSDITVKVWRPHSEERPATIGLHSDYVKCLASPGQHSSWVASGGLDHKIKIWDLNGGGEKLHIDIGEHEASAKGSVYALSVCGSIMASGGPESIVRLWDPKSGKRITNFVGHTDNVRDILINEDGDIVMTASSDQTVKVWSITAGRCIHTLTMHNDSVWSLFSDHPQLSVFYSSDRSGVIAKTDVRRSPDMDEGLSLAIAKEHDGVNKAVVAGEFVWTATSSSSINRWKDVDTTDTTGEIQEIELARTNRAASIISHSKIPSPTSPSFPTNSGFATNPKIPRSCILRISNNAVFPGQAYRDAESSNTNSGISARKMSEAIVDPELGIVTPYHNLPEETIEGQNGLIKHVMLNDRKRVLTLDTAGEVMMWDILECKPIQSFGKRHLEDVTPEVNTIESVANWCAVDTRTGRLACVLEENYCFDAEMYADELEAANNTELRDDQRINFGKWVLRYLFSNLIEEELKRDYTYRASLLDDSRKPDSFRRNNAPHQLQLPVAAYTTRQNGNIDDDSQITPRATNENLQSATTPGLSIGVATPHPSQFNNNLHPQSQLASTSDDRTSLEKQQSRQSQSRASSDKSADYFSNNPNRQSFSEDHVKSPTTPGDGAFEASSQSPVDADKEEKSREGTTLFGKKFRMTFPKKLGRSSVEAKPVAVDQKSEASDKSEGREDKNIDDNFFGTIQKIRYEYKEQLHNNPAQQLLTGLAPSPPSETPLLRPPPSTTVIIQEDRPDSGGVADLYRGTIKSLGRDADLVEKAGPMWLGELLMKNQIPFKEISKVSFLLLPYQDLLPSIASLDGNSRLNANRMLRAKKVLAYVAERIEPQAEDEDPNALKPEEYLELYCHNQLVPPTTTLATLRAHIWKTGGDVMLYYKSNGRKPSLDQRMSHDTPEESHMRQIAHPQ